MADPAQKIKTFPFSTFAEIAGEKPEPRRWLIKGLLKRNELSIMWGESGSGKTQASIDLALHLALGLDWRGHKVKAPAGVLFVAAEGGDGIQDRVRAWARENGKASVKNVPFAIVRSAVDLTSPKGGEALLCTIDAAEGQFDCAFGLVILDTLNATAPGADENSAGAMSAYLANVRELRNGKGRHVMILHHCGKDRGKGLRGSTALLGAIDAEFEVLGSRTSKLFTLTQPKQRDGSPEVEEWHYAKKPIILGKDEDGDPITAVCAVASDRGPAERLSSNADRVMNTLRTIVSETGQVEFTRSEVRRACEAVLVNSDKNGNPPKPSTVAMKFTRALQELVAAELLEIQGEGAKARIIMLEAA